METNLTGRSSIKFHRPETLRFHRSAIEKVLNLMHADPGGPLNWDVLSKTACISRYHFLRIFEGLTEVSPHRFLMALRMEKAKRLLLESSISVTEISLQTGYASVATFVRVFKTLVGLSPSIFRQSAATLQLAELRPLLTEDNPGPPDAISFQVKLRIPENFAGMIFAALFDSALPQGPLISGKVINQPGSLQFNLPAPKSVGYLQIIACPHPSSNDIKDYLLWDSSRMLAASVLLSSRHQKMAGKQIELGLQYPSQYDPPIVPSLPLLLLNLVRSGSDPE